MPSPGSASHLRQAGVEGTRMGVTLFPPSQNDKGGQTGPHFAEPGTGYFTQEVPRLPPPPPSTTSYLGLAGGCCYPQC